MIKLRINRAVVALRGATDARRKSRINVLEAFPAFAPASSGSYPMKAPLAIDSINGTLRLLAAVAKQMDSEQGASLFRTSAEFESELGGLSRDHVERFGLLLEKNGSDKARNDYHRVYGAILSEADAPYRILEIGLGTSNDDIVSHMGEEGSPGASLRAFRDLLPNAEVFGADVDDRILFSEERITTFSVDQTDEESLTRLAAAVPGELDLVIDDGLHAPHANLATLLFGLGKLRAGGWIVIEDIPPEARDLWVVVGALLEPAGHAAYLIEASEARQFAVRKNGRSGTG